MRWRPREAILLVLGLVLILGIGNSTSAARFSSQAILQKLEEVQNKTLENTSRIEELASQVSVLRQQNREILTILKDAHRQSSSGGAATQLEQKLEQMEAQIEELRIQLQILVKAIMALIGILILILLYMFFKSRRSSRYGRLRI